MIEDLLPFLLMLAGMVIIGGVWAFMTLRQAFRGPNYYSQSYGSDWNQYEIPSSEASAGRGGGLQG